MNIMFEDSITDAIKSKYVLLPLDTFYFSNIKKNKTAYCLIELMPIQDLMCIEKNLELHNNLVKNYRLQNWKYCDDALEHLIGKWDGKVDSFYNEINARIKILKEKNPGLDWTGIISRD